MDRYPTIAEYKEQGKWPLEFIAAKGLLPVLNDLSDRLGRKVIGVEIGICTGESMTYLLDSTDKIEEIYGIDPYLSYKDWDKIIDQEQIDDYYRVAKENLADHIDAGRAQIIKNISKNASDFFDNESLDWVFIDGDHSYECARLDMHYWWPKVKVGGVFAGHDLNLDTVKRAIIEHAQTLGIEKLTINTLDCNAWYWIKQ